VDKHFTLIKKNVKRAAKRAENSARYAQSDSAVDKRRWSKKDARVKIIKVWRQK
jgi:hypothetical protein